MTQNFLQSNQEKKKNISNNENSQEVQGAKAIEELAIEELEQDEFPISNNSQNLIQMENPSNNENYEPKRRSRRKKLDDEGRNYTCVCGKSYLSYPALYTHVKTKHNGQVSVSQKLCIPSYSIDVNKIVESRQVKVQKTQKDENDEDKYSIEQLKQYLNKQFIKEKSKATLIELTNSLKLRDDQIKYINQIVRLNDDGELKIQDGQNAQFNSNSKPAHEHYNKEDINETPQALQSFPQNNKYEKINILRNILERNQKQLKSTKKGFSSYMVPIQQYESKKGKVQETIVDQIFGAFLQDVLKTAPYHDIITLLLTYYICKIKEFYDKKFKECSTSYKIGQSLIEESNSLVNHLIELQNIYLRHPIVVCKLLFFFYRWMFKNQFTSKLVRFNQVGA